MKFLKYPLSFYIKNSTIHYFLSHPIELLVFYGKILYLRYILPMVHGDYNCMSNQKSMVPIDVVITTVGKDIDVLPIVIHSIRHCIRHPINTIYIVAPASQKIVDLSKRNQCKFIDEDKVLPIKKNDLRYAVNGTDRSGWIFQQLLKFSADTFCTSSHILITESDTVYVRPHIFMKKGKIIFSCSNRISHIPYFEMYKKLFHTRMPAFENLTSHHMLYTRKNLIQMKKSIERSCHTVWWQAIIDRLDIYEGSCISDYDTYGHYVLSVMRKMVIFEYWFNLSLSRRYLTSLEKLIEQYRRQYKTVSFHSYEI